MNFMGGQGSGKKELTAKYSVELGYSFDTTLGNNLSFLKNAVMNQDYDAVIIIDGGEGLGKSTIGQQVAVMLDIDGVIDEKKQKAFTPQSFMEKVTTLPKFKAVIYDEARRGLDRRKFGTSASTNILDMLAECRQRNLFLIIIMPSFYDMDMNVSVWRSRALIHVTGEWSGLDEKGEIPLRPLKRGTFRFYNEAGKKELYTNDFLRKKYSYPYVKNLSFDGRFSSHFPGDYTLYKKLKSESIKDFHKKKDKFSCPVCNMNYERKLKDGRFKCRRGHYWGDVEK